MPVAQLAEAGQEPVGRDDDPAVALDRLDDDGRHRTDTRRRIVHRVTHEAKCGVADGGVIASPERPAIRVRIREEVRIRLYADRFAEACLARQADDAGAPPEVPA